MLLRTDRTGKYRGVDREPFEPLIEDDADVPGRAGSTAISNFYSAGWKRDLYRLAESDSSHDFGFLFTRITTAVAIREQLAEHAGTYEILLVEIMPLLAQPAGRSNDPRAGPFLGYDLAYLGGDFYSAIRNGLFVNPDPALLAEFGADINEFGLFADRDAATKYLAAFRRSVPSESTSEFHLYALRSVSREEMVKATRAN